MKYNEHEKTMVKKKKKHNKEENGTGKYSKLTQNNNTQVVEPIMKVLTHSNNGVITRL